MIIFRKFTTKNAKLAESPKQEKNDVSIQLFVTLPDGSDTQQDSHSVVPGTTLKKIVQDFKHNISSVVGVEIKSVTLNTKSGGRSDNKLNYIMIPISFSVLVILCVVACCLHCSRYVSMFEIISLVKKMIFVHRLQLIKVISEKNPDKIQAN